MYVGLYVGSRPSTCHVCHLYVVPSPAQGQLIATMSPEEGLGLKTSLNTRRRRLCRRRRGSTGQGNKGCVGGRSLVM